ncbi:MAG TPA: phosphoribosyltransferase family protein [Pyrinomonadaceae bacterium]|nr:phosphoribosyltransferase family protein [Pyrinomonadaceae bacterium]
MTGDILKTLPVRRGHFLLESGYHTDRWFTLDALFLSPEDMTPQVNALVDMLKPYAITAVCGPLLGGAFLAQAVALHMGVHFYFTEPTSEKTGAGLFAVKYQLPPALRALVSSERIAIVDDMISAGSSVRATAAELMAAGAPTVVIGTLVLLGNQATEYFATSGVPLVALTRENFNLWSPSACSLCQTEIPLENPLDLKR